MASNGKKAKKKVTVEAKDARSLSQALTTLADEVPLDYKTALKVGHWKREVVAAAETHQREVGKADRAIRTADPGDNPTPAQTEAFLETVEAENERIRELGKGTFKLPGSKLDWDDIEHGLKKKEKDSKEPVEGLGNILAGLFPVLDGLPGDYLGE